MFSNQNSDDYFRSENISAPQEQIRHMLRKFELQQRELFLQQSTAYIQSNPNEKNSLFSSIFDLFFGLPKSKFTSGLSIGPIYSRSYLDLSLIYKDRIDYDLMYKFITPAAELATVELLRKNYSFNDDKDVEDLISSVKADDSKVW